jgi:hypothetical protein
MSMIIVDNEHDRSPVARFAGSKHRKRLVIYTRRNTLLNCNIVALTNLDRHKSNGSFDIRMASVVVDVRAITIAQSCGQHYVFPFVVTTKHVRLI